MFAQYAVVAPQSLVKIDPAVPMDVAALFGCAIITGAGAVFNSAKVQPRATVAIIGLGGVDHAFEISGHPAALDMAQAIAVRGGEVVGVGVGKSSAAFSVPHYKWVAEERVLRGSFVGGGVPQQDIPKYVDLYLSGRLPVDKLRSEHIGFDRLNQGFDQLQSGAVVRQILLPHGV